MSGMGICISKRVERLGIFTSALDWWGGTLEFQPNVDCGPLPMNLVAADVRRLTLFAAKKSEPPYVGCYENYRCNAQRETEKLAFAPSKSRANAC